LITLKASVQASKGAAIPTGTVTFFDGTSPLGTANLSAGTASVSTTRLSEGQHSISALYAGTSEFRKSTSSPVSVSVVSKPVVALVSTSTAVTSSTSQADQGYTISLTASVTAASGTASPTGLVVFSAGTKTLGTTTLTNGHAYLSTAALPVGDVTITASYSGNQSFAPSASKGIQVTVSGPDFTVKATPGTVSAKLGENVDVALLITPKNGFNQVPQLSCAGLPEGATCSFAKAAKQADGTSIVNMTIHTDSTMAEWHGSHSPGGSSRAPIAFALLPLLLCLSPRKRKEFCRLVSLSMLLLALVLGGSAIGCGGRAATTSTHSSAAGTVKITVTAQTPTGLSHSADVELNLN
jgi:hypothetical protein